jgi:hypothetical protein
LNINKLGLKSIWIFICKRPRKANIKERKTKLDH